VPLDISSSLRKVFLALDSVHSEFQCSRGTFDTLQKEAELVRKNSLRDVALLRAVSICATGSTRFVGGYDTYPNEARLNPINSHEKARPSDLER
jgi:hypothetical protein